MQPNTLARWEVRIGKDRIFYVIDVIDTVVLVNQVLHKYLTGYTKICLCEELDHGTLRQLAVMTPSLTTNLQAHNVLRQASVLLHTRLMHQRPERAI
ncbi:hypothetical protein EYB53_000020 [Candidatus Chloroploca sp. M-50]|uniref:Uncharacterized protein n=1 Tax=Candidatus Chloroploca mongolica TaxID=2528176 RepID=A0ABS4D3T0_9CHLR|nr:hypothetical protein [Candidatus Chloroploca mongolica]MBP1464085.1 hypothetical protein [Candidatus Chloroploca mongolica]